MQGEPTNWISIAKDWQTLLAALIAIGVAWFSIRPIKKQADLQLEAFDEERRRKKELRDKKLLAVRAHMPDALSALCAYTTDCVKFLENAEAEIPLRPSDAVTVFKGAIEYIDSESAQTIFEMVSFYQVQVARFFNFAQNRSEYLESDVLYDIVLFRSYVDRIFDYARNETDIVPVHEPANDEMLSALKASVGLRHYAGNKERYTEVLGKIERRHPSK